MAAVVVLAALVAAGVWANDSANGYYAFQPGTAPTITTSASCKAGAGGELALPGGTPCVRLVVPAGRIHRIDGRLMMVDVLVGTATPIEWALAQLHLLDVVHPGSQLVPAAEVLGSTPPGQLPCQDTQQMTGATSTAALVALQRLGYKVGVSDLGAQINLVLPGSPAARAGLRCNDLVTAVGGSAVSTAGQLSSDLKAHAPGSRVSLTVKRVGASGKVESLTLSAVLGSVPAQAGFPAQPHEGFLGVGTSTSTAYKFPFGVSIDVGAIGGPSAGLALTLGLLDILANGHLTGGHAVAATGVINANGTVGAIGGVAQKAVAVAKAGAQLFLVPTANFASARRHAPPHLRVEAVASLSQALADLRAIGGQVPS